MSRRKWMILGTGLLLLGFVAAFMLRWMFRLDAMSLVVPRDEWATMGLDQRVLPVQRQSAGNDLLDLGLLKIEADKFVVVSHLDGELIGDLVLDGRAYRIVVNGDTTDVYEETYATLQGFGVDLAERYDSLGDFGAGALVFFDAWSYTPPSLFDVAIWDGDRTQSEVLRLVLARALHVRSDRGSAGFQTKDLCGRVFYITPSNEQWQTGALIELFSPVNNLHITLMIASERDESHEEFESQIVRLLEAVRPVEGDFDSEEDLISIIDEAIASFETADP